MTIKVILGTFGLIVHNNLSLASILFLKGFYYYAGYVNYAINIAITYFIVSVCMKSDFYKNLTLEDKK